MEEITKLIEAIHQQYPWASQETMQEIVELFEKTDYKVGTQALKQLGLEVEQHASNIKKTNKHIKNANTILKSSGESMRGTLRSLERGDDPIEQFTGLLDGVAGGAEELAEGFKTVPGVGGLLGRGADFVTSNITVVTATLGAMGGVISNQEKSARAMIDFGMATRNLTDFDRLKTNAALVGQSFNELLQNTQGSTIMLANVDKDMLSANIKFSNMLVDVEKLSGAQGDFGFSVEELSTRFIEEADLMFQLRDLQTLDNTSRDKIWRNLAQSSTMATTLATLTGKDRSALLERRKEALEDVNFRLAMRQNEEYIVRNFGEAAIANLENTQGFLESQAAEISPTLAPMLQETFQRGFKNIQFGRNPITSANEELLGVLSLLPANQAQGILGTLEDMITGRIAPSELPSAVASIANTIENSPVQRAVDANTQNLQLIQSEVGTAQDRLRNITTQQFQDLQNQSVIATEGADDAIDAMDNLRIAFRSSLDTITPGFQGSTTALNFFSDGVDTLGGVITTVFPGLASYESRLERAKKEGEARARRSGRNRARVGSGAHTPTNPGRQAPATAETTPSTVDNTQPPQSGARSGRNRARSGSSAHTPAPVTSTSPDAASQVTTNTPPFTAGTGPIDPYSLIDDSGIQGKIRNDPIDPKLAQILANAAAVVSPDLSIQLTSGGQMGKSEAEAAGGRIGRDRRGSGSQAMFVNGEAVRTGSTRHDHGMAADMRLILDGKTIPHTHELARQFMQAAFAFGITSGSAGYMGPEVFHMDITEGGARTWSNPTSSFRQAMSTGLAMGQNENNVYQQRLAEITTPQTQLNSSTNNSEVTSDIARLEAELAETTSRVSSTMESHTAAGIR